MSTTESTPAFTSNDRSDQMDFVEAGTGPLALLIHSSMAGAHQWSALTRCLEDDFQFRAVNLFGYGKTPPWAGTKPPTLEDFADLVASAVPETTREINIVGHSFGGAVAMCLATRLRGRVNRLVLIEPSLFYLLDRCGRYQAFDEICALEHDTRRWIAAGMPQLAAERFIDYWCGSGAWDAISPTRRSSIAKSIFLLRNEWAAILNGSMTPADLAAALPRNTLVMSSRWTTRPAREIVKVLLDTCSQAEFAGIPAGGHMAPLTHPHLVNPIIKDFLSPTSINGQRMNKLWRG